MLDIGMYKRREVGSRLWSRWNVCFGGNLREYEEGSKIGSRNAKTKNKGGIEVPMGDFERVSLEAEMGEENTEDGKETTRVELVLGL